MNIYHFKPGTGEYIGSTEAQPDPADEGQFLVPAYSTKRKPPRVKAGEKAYFLREQSKWEIRVDVDEEKASEPVQTDDQKIAQLRAAARQHTNAVARKLDFDSMDEAVSYAEEPAVPLYQRQGIALRAWRSRFWFEYEAQERAMRAGTIPAKFEDIVDALPVFEPPSVT